jgi:hypothetical protein
MSAETSGKLCIKEPSERIVIRSFIQKYFNSLSVPFDTANIQYPEDDTQVSPDARIDAVYSSPFFGVHIEHTSFDLIISKGKRKRVLDPAFCLLEQQLKQIYCPEGKGVQVLLPMEYAKDIPSLKQSLPKIVEKVKIFIDETASQEWEKYPRPSDHLQVDHYTFSIRPDVFKGSQVSLAWTGSEITFLEGALLQNQIQKALKAKLPKLDRSFKLYKKPAYGILLIETNDIAAPSFYSSCGTFAAELVKTTFPPEEIWGLFGNSDPILIWSKTLDHGITHCVYSEDPSGRTYAEIQDDRMERWEINRKHWITSQEI